MATKKAATKKASTKKPAEWPPRAVGSDALESLRDGNPPHALIAFARNAVGAGNSAWAIEFLQRGVEYLRYVMTSFPDVADRVAGQHDLLVRMLVDIAVATGDEPTLEFSLLANPKPTLLANTAERLKAAKHFAMAVHWFVRARQLTMTAGERHDHLRRFGLAELSVRTRAKLDDVAVAREFVEFAEEGLRNFDPQVDYAAARKLELEQLLHAAKKVLAPADASDEPETATKSPATGRGRKTM